MDRAISSDYSTKQPSHYETENSADNASTARFGASLKQVKVAEAKSTELPHQHDEGVSSTNSLANSSITIATATATATATNKGEFDEDSKQYVSQKVEEIKKECRIVPLNEQLKEQTLCKVCLDNAVCIVFLPCGHLVTCADCAPALRKCPSCRALVKGTVRTYETENSANNAPTARFGGSLKQVKVAEAKSTVLPHQHDEGVSSTNSLANSSITIATATATATATNKGEFDEDSKQYVSQKVEEIKKECMTVPLNEQLKEQTLCKVCLDQTVCIVFLPCGHFVTCADCAPTMRECPSCRALVQGTVRTYTS